MQITPEEIAETLAMVSKQHLDIRTITLGLNLRSCTDSDINTMARKVYDKMTKAAEQLVPTAEQLEREFGIPDRGQAHLRHSHRRDVRRRARHRRCRASPWPWTRPGAEVRRRLRGRLLRARAQGRIGR